MEFATANSCSADKSIRLYRYFCHSVVEDDASSSSFAFVHFKIISTGHAKTVVAERAYAPDRQHDGKEEEGGGGEA